MYFCIVCVTPLVKISSVLMRLACLNKVFTYLPTYQDGGEAYVLQKPGR